MSESSVETFNLVHQLLYQYLGDKQVRIGVDEAIACEIDNYIYAKLDKQVEACVSAMLDEEQKAHEERYLCATMDELVAAVRNARFGEVKMTEKDYIHEALKSLDIAACHGNKVILIEELLMKQREVCAEAAIKEAIQYVPEWGITVVKKYMDKAVRNARLGKEDE
jgi:hypothetical protein